MKWVFWSIKLSLAEAERQTTGIQLEGFFKNYRESARITGVNEDLVHRFYVILQIISSGFEMNTEEFDKYTKDMAKLFVQAYPWFYMPASVHKVLVHGADTISEAILPVGQLSEESRNKDLKSFRRSHSRKMC
jgi:hypothetical protein